MAVRENRLFIIERKIISLKNIRELASVIWGEYEQAKEGDSTAYILFSVKCFDNSSFEGEDISIFEEDSLITKRRVKSVTIEFRASKSKFIKLRLIHGYTTTDEKKEVSDSDMEIGGDDIMWVGGISDKLNNIVQALPNQEAFILNHQGKLMLGAIAVGIYGFGLGMDIIDAGKSPAYWSGSTGDIVGKSFAALVFGGLIGFFIIQGAFLNRINEIWPITELQVGPEHMLLEKKKRAFLWQLWTLIVLPIVIAVMLSFFHL